MYIYETKNISRLSPSITARFRQLLKAPSNVTVELLLFLELYRVKQLRVDEKRKSRSAIALRNGSDVARRLEVRRVDFRDVQLTHVSYTIYRVLVKT